LQTDNLKDLPLKKLTWKSWAIPPKQAWSMCETEEGSNLNFEWPKEATMKNSRWEEEEATGQ
jgi:hypothetical protein